MKYSCTVVLLLMLLTGKVYSQLANECRRRINNDTVTYAIYYNSFFLNEETVPKKVLCRLQTADFNTCDSERVVAYITENFDSLYMNESTDWATNIILYHFLQEDAAVLVGGFTIQEWRCNYKQDCIDLWRKRLGIDEQ